MPVSTRHLRDSVVPPRLPKRCFLKVLKALMPPSNFEGNIFYIYSHLYAWGKPNSRGGNSQQAEAKSEALISTYSVLAYSTER